MQPNENMPGAGQAAGPTRPVAPANPVKPVNPVTPLKPVEPAGGPTFDNGPSVVEGKGGKKTGWIMAVVLLLIVAAGGVGFGVWAWVDGNTQKDALNDQISSLKKQNSELMEQISSLNDEIEEMKNNENANGGETVSDGAIKAELLNGVFYVKNDSGETLKSDSSIGVTEIISCDYFADNFTLKCAVVVGDNEGWILYNSTDGSLTSSFDVE